MSQVGAHGGLVRKKRALDGDRSLRGSSGGLGHARGAFGDNPVAKVTKADVERLADKMQADGLSARTASLRLGLAVALADGRAVRNVAPGVSGHSGQAATRTRSPWTQEPEASAARRCRGCPER